MDELSSQHKFLGMLGSLLKEGASELASPGNTKTYPIEYISMLTRPLKHLSRDTLIP
jgi:hypothetical protein